MKDILPKRNLLEDAQCHRFRVGPLGTNYPTCQLELGTLSAFLPRRAAINYLNLSHPILVFKHRINLSKIGGVIAKLFYKFPKCGYLRMTNKKINKKMNNLSSNCGSCGTLCLYRVLFDSLYNGTNRGQMTLHLFP